MYVTIDKGVRRSFSITFGLVEGYGEKNYTHTPIGVKKALKRWMKKRLKVKEDILTGTVLYGDTVYAWDNGDGTFGDGEEPSAIFMGEVSVKYGAHLKDEEVEVILNDLANFVGHYLKQTRVYVSYRDEAWILEKEKDAETPNGK